MGSLRTIKSSSEHDYLAAFLFPKYKITKTVIQKARKLAEIVTRNMNNGVGEHPEVPGTYFHLLIRPIEPGVLEIAHLKFFSFNILSAVMETSDSRLVLVTQQIEGNFSGVMYELVPILTPEITQAMLTGD